MLEWDLGLQPADNCINPNWLCVPNCGETEFHFSVD